MNPTPHPDESPQADALQAGLDASRNGDADAAIRWFRIACERNPAAVVPAFLLGAELAQAGEVAEAENAYARAVLLDPGLDMARFQLGLLQFMSSRAAMAALTWAPLLERPDAEPLRHIVQGFVALMRSDFEAAVAGLSHGRQLVQSNDALRNDLTMVIERIRMASQTPSNPAAGEIPGTDGTSGAQADDIGAHFLLSSYRIDGPLH